MRPEKEKREYVEEFALHFERTGLSRSAGRIWGWLLISDPPHQTMDDLVESLQVSKSSVSTATRTLIQMNLIQRVSLPNERRDYYRVADGIWENAFRNRFGQVTEFRKLAEKGLSLLDDKPDEQRERLQEMRDLYAFIEQAVPRLMLEWEEQRKGK